MKNKDIKTVVPALRFPEFRGAEGWNVTPLSKYAKQITEKAKNGNYTPLSVTSGVGLVSQIEKFGREIAGEQYKNYYVINKFDFAYNKSATNLYPEGYISMLKNLDRGAVPNSIFTCFRVDKDKIHPQYINQLFHDNFHGKWLRKYIEVGSRANGALSIDSKILLNLLIPLPKLKEQQKIADCLGNLDDFISAVADKIEVLKEHKKGLMQQLFPADGKITPTLRFPEFQNAGEWKEKPMEEIFTIRNGYTPSKSNSDYWTDGTIPWFRMEDIRENGTILSDSIQHITPEAVKGNGLFPANSIIVATTATIGVHALIIVDSLANQRFTFLTKRKSLIDKLDMVYFYHYMFIVDEWCKKNINMGGFASVNMTGFKKLLIPIPKPAEQQRIANCLSSVDELISAEIDKLNQLKAHKKGLMQQLFPSL